MESSKLSPRQKEVFANLLKMPLHLFCKPPVFELDILYELDPLSNRTDLLVIDFSQFLEIDGESYQTTLQDHLLFFLQAYRPSLDITVLEKTQSLKEFLNQFLILYRSTITVTENTLPQIVLMNYDTPFYVDGHSADFKSQFKENMRSFISVLKNDGISYFIVGLMYQVIFNKAEELVKVSDTIRLSRELVYCTKEELCLSYQGEEYREKVTRCLELAGSIDYECYNPSVVNILMEESMLNLNQYPLETLMKVLKIILPMNLVSNLYRIVPACCPSLGSRGVEYRLFNQRCDNFSALAYALGLLEIRREHPEHSSLSELNWGSPFLKEAFLKLLENKVLHEVTLTIHSVECSR